MNRKSSVPNIVFMVLTLLLSASGAIAHEQVASQSQAPMGASCFVATLAGGQETPPNDSSARGTGLFVLSPDRSKLIYNIQFSGLSSAETAAHIHIGAPGVAGPIVFPLPLGATKAGTQPLSAQNLNDLMAGLYYVNVHSGNFPNGEIRGQIMPSAACFKATLTGSQETPPTGSSATGMGTFVLSPDQTKLTYYIEYSGLSSAETAAHIHQAPVGVPGSVVFPLTPTGSPKTGTLTLTADQVVALASGQYYVNIHSSNFPNGEIRGQIMLATNCFTAMLTGAQETPPTGSAATGFGTFSLSSDQTRLFYAVSYSGLSSTELAAHIHKAPIGTPGPIVFPLPLGMSKQGMITLTPQNLADLVTGLYYGNVHSSNFTGGEIRGQIMPSTCTIYLPIIRFLQ